MSDQIHSSQPNAQAVAASEARLRALVIASSDVIYSLSPDWEVMRELDGRGFLKDARQPTTNWRSLNVHPDDLEKVNAAIKEAIAYKKTFELEHQVWRADGTPGWTFSRAVPILDDQDNIIEWFGTASDISDRKHAEQALREAKQESEQQKRVYETINSGTPDLIYVFDLNYRFTYVNRALLMMWGKTWEAAIGKNLLENGYEPWHAEMHEREIDLIKVKKIPIRGEVAFPHAILGRRIYDYILTPVFDAEGNVEAVAGITRDITERKEWEESLSRNSEALQALNEEMTVTNEEQAASNEELAAANKALANVNQQLLEAQFKIEEGEIALRLAIDAAGLGTFYVDTSDLKLIASAKLKELFGYHPHEEIDFETGINLVHPDFRDQVRDAVDAAFTKGTRFDLEYPIIGYHDGKIRWVRGIGEMQQNDGKNYFTGILHEITEKKQDEIRKNDFIGMVSHELKTPLTSIKGYIQILSLKLKSHEDDLILGALDKVNTQVAKMTGMINGFLNVSRLDSGKIHVDLQHFDLAELIRDSEEETKTTITSHTLLFEPVSSALVYADREKIGQVIHNLISNAVKYSTLGSTIQVSCILHQGAAAVSVKDFGMGIKADDQDKIFDRYYRVEGSQMSSISGFGVGLYLCSEIIKRHQGQISVESNFGEGSTFTFKLPLLAG